MPIQSDIQKLDPGALIELFELDATASNIGAPAVLRFHSGTNELQNDIVWGGNTYTKYPIEASGFEWSGRGTLPRPKIKVANLGGYISALCAPKSGQGYDDLIGAKVVRKRTFAKYLDSVNFASSNILTYTEAFNAVAWVKADTTILTNTMSTSDGKVTLDKIVEVNTSAPHSIYQTYTVTANTYTMSAYCKAAERSWVRIGTDTHHAWFNISTGAIGTQVSCTAAIEVADTGIYRCSIVMTLTAGSYNFYVFTATANNDTTYLGVLTSGIHAGGIQLEIGTLSKYKPIDTVQNPYADPNAHFADEIWYVDRKAGENKIFVEFELAPAFDVMGVKLPRRQTIQNVCTWKYKSTECGYVPGSYFDTSDVPCTAGNDVCGKRLTSCRLRFESVLGLGCQLPYGGFPGVGLIR